MIPFALMGAKIQQNNGSVQEIRMLELAPDRFTFRLTGEDACMLKDKPLKIRVFGYQLKTGSYEWVELEDFEVYLKDDQAEDYVLFELVTEDPDFIRLSKEVSKQYMDYIELKLYEEDARLSEVLTGYPSEEEKIFAPDLNTQKLEWMGNLKADEHWRCGMESVPEAALCLDHAKMWQQFLKLEISEFKTWYMHSMGLSDHPIAGRQITHIYVGNQFCPLLFPDPETLAAILDKCALYALWPVVVFSFMDEDQAEICRQVLKNLRGLGFRGEIVVNDWGMLKLLRDEFAGEFKIDFGILMNKRRKDVRLKYKSGVQHQNPLNAPFFVDYLEKLGVCGAESEFCEYIYRLPEMENHIHLPFYQMNTAGLCTLYAKCYNKKRGHQTHLMTCKAPCETNVFLYPKMLHMAGVYNTLFGYDTRCLQDGTYFKTMTEGAQRLVIHML